LNIKGKRQRGKRRIPSQTTGDNADVKRGNLLVIGIKKPGIAGFFRADIRIRY
jgi:hypothetical protein